MASLDLLGDDDSNDKNKSAAKKKKKKKKEKRKGKSAKKNNRAQNAAASVQKWKLLGEEWELKYDAAVHEMGEFLRLAEACAEASPDASAKLKDADSSEGTRSGIETYVYAGGENEGGGERGAG